MHACRAPVDGLVAVREGVAFGVVIAHYEVHAAACELRVRLLQTQQFAAPDEVALLHAEVSPAFREREREIINTTLPL